MNDGMNNVPTTTGERSMGLYAWHECVHDEEEAGGGEAGGIDLGISLREALLDFRLAFFFLFLTVPRGGGFGMLLLGMGWIPTLPNGACCHWHGMA